MKGQMGTVTLTLVSLSPHGPDLHLCSQLECKVLPNTSGFTWSRLAFPLVLAPFSWARVVWAEGHRVGWEKEGKEFPSQEMVQLVYYSSF